MPQSLNSDDVTLGFLSVSHDEHTGYAGGLLVLNRRGRPVEFRCTAPVQPSQAQQVLYGPTLAPYVCGELISDALFQHTQAQPALVITNHVDNMSARQRLTVPLVLLNLEQEHAAQVATNSADRPPTDTPAARLSTPEMRPSWQLHGAHGHLRGPRRVTFEMGRRTVSTLEEFASDKDLSLQVWEQANDWIELAEPFDRIAEAIDEALRG